MPLSLTALEDIIRDAWSAETAWTPAEWSAGNPAAGQCFSSAYVVKSLLGGEIVHAELIPHATPKQRHAWNRLPGGLELDLTGEQFSPDQGLLPCELPPELVWQFGGKQAALLLERVYSRLRSTAVVQGCLLPLVP